MANLTTNHDLIADALFRAGEPTDGTSDFYQQSIINYNRVYQSLCSGGMELAKDVDETWWWLRKPTPGVLTLQPAFLGSASVTFNSNAVVLSNPPAYSMAKWYFYIQNTFGDVFRVTAHTGGSGVVTLDSPYTGATNAAAAVRIIQLEYDLASDLRSIIGPMSINSDDFQIDGCELDSFLGRYPSFTVQQGPPELFAMVGEQRVRFSHYPGDTGDLIFRVEYNYLVVPADLADDANVPLVPREYRRVLSDYTTMWILNEKNDPRAGAMGQSAASALTAMARENRRRLTKMGHKFGQLFSRQDQLVRRIPQSTSGFYYP